MKKNLLYIVIIIVISVLAIFINVKRPSDQNSNAFSRKIVSKKIELLNAIKLPDISFGFVGTMDSCINLNRYSDGLHLYKIDYSLKKIDTIPIKFPSEFKTDAFNIYKDILSHYIYATNMYGDISVFNGKTSKPYKFKESIFDIFQAISPNSIIVRSRYDDKGTVNRSISKLKLSDTVLRDKEYRLPKASNGIFINDGVLYYDRENLKVIYMYYYKGRILNLDTNLNLINDIKTVDTVNTAQIKTVEIDNKKSGTQNAKVVTQSAPPIFVNSCITTYKHNIYVASRLKADNEEKSSFNNKQIIDVYDCFDGKYKNSFYIPKHNNENIRQFQLKDDYLAVIYTNYLVVYRIKEL